MLLRLGRGVVAGRHRTPGAATGSPRPGLKKRAALGRTLTDAERKSVGDALQSTRRRFLGVHRGGGGAASIG